MRLLAFAAAIAAFFSSYSAQAGTYILADDSLSDATYTLVGNIPNPISVRFSIGASAVALGNVFVAGVPEPVFSAEYVAEIQILDNSNTVVQTDFAVFIASNPVFDNPFPSTVFLTTSDSDRTVHVNFFGTDFFNVAASGALFVTLPDGVAAVPEPSTWAMMIVGFAGIGFMAYRRRKLALA